MFVAKLLVLAVGLLPLSSSTPIHARQVTVPSKDEFYTPPPGFEAEPPGTILRQRIILPAIFGFIPDPVETHQLLYRTTAINGTPIATVTTIFKPLLAMNDRFVSFQTAYDSAFVDCSPSYTYQLGASQDDLVTAAEFLIIQTYLLSGYIVSASDYEGPDAAFAAGRLEGMGTLDSMRSVVNYGNTLGLSTTPMIVGVGYSGGAIATGWAASLQSDYAPELKVKGWVCGGTPANLTDILVAVDGTLVSGFLPIAIDGLNKPSTYGTQISALLESVLTPKGKSVLDYANTHCVVETLLEYPDMSILDTDFQTLGPSLLYEPLVQSLLGEGTMGLTRNETPTAPVLLYHASQDEIVPYADVPGLAERWCDNGATVQFYTFAAGGHVTTEVLGLPNALEFTASAFADTIQSGCLSASEYSSSLDILALAADIEPVGFALAQILLDAGDQDENILNDLSVLNG